MKFGYIYRLFRKMEELEKTRDELNEKILDLASNIDTYERHDTWENRKLLEEYKKELKSINYEIYVVDMTEVEGP